MAVTVIVPAPVRVARPNEVTAARFALEDVEITRGMTSSVVPLKAARPFNSVKPPCSKLLAAGDTTREAEVPLVTVKDAVPSCPLNSAVMVTVPGSSPVTCPALMVATDGSEDVHKAHGVRS